MCLVTNPPGEGGCSKEKQKEEREGKHEQAKIVGSSSSKPAADCELNKVRCQGHTAMHNKEEVIIR